MRSSRRRRRFTIKRHNDCSGGLFVEAARYRACASRTAGIRLILRKTGAHLLRLRAVALALRGRPLQQATSADQALSGSFSQIQQIGISNVAKAAIAATAEKPRRSNAGAATAAIAAIPSCENALRRAMYSPRISGTTISVVSACSG